MRKIRRAFIALICLLLAVTVLFLLWKTNSKLSWAFWAIAAVDATGSCRPGRLCCRGVFCRTDLLVAAGPLQAQSGQTGKTTGSATGAAGSRLKNNKSPRPASPKPGHRCCSGRYCGLSCTAAVISPGPSASCRSGFSRDPWLTVLTHCSPLKWLIQVVGAASAVTCASWGYVGLERPVISRAISVA